MHAPVPPLRPKPVLGMKDMGMGGMDHGGMSGMDHGSMQGMDHGSGGGSMESGSMSMSHDMRDKSLVPPNVKVGVGVDMIAPIRSEEHTSEVQSLMRISYAVFCLKKKHIHRHNTNLCA